MQHRESGARTQQLWCKAAAVQVKADYPIFEDGHHSRHFGIRWNAAFMTTG